MYGIHVAKKSKILGNIRKTMLDSIIDDTETLDLNASQIFTYGPRNRNRNSMNYNNIKNYCADSNIYLVVHSSYMTPGIWSVLNMNKNEPQSKLIINHLANQLISCSKTGAHGLVVHLPCKSPESICETMKIIEPMIKKNKVPIFLEIESRKPTEFTYETPDKLNTLCRQLSACVSNKIWGICVDTAHLWASGCDISSKSNATQWLHNLNYPQKIKLLHFNGAISKMGVSKDIHAIAFSDQDQIWGAYKGDEKMSGAYTFIKFCKTNHVPVICEINRGSQKNAEYLFEFIKENLL